ncbi:hypothetical protein [Micromonospora sp. NPDC049679]|uniref:hypothetical protein n=1 Tax=Micromonospora sp. NPDC049679 TaxID=3155920 RepID=UPI0033FA4694
MERLLDALRDDPLPPSAVDIERALTDGRRSVRRRRMASVVAAGCAVLAVAGGVSVAGLPNAGTPPAVEQSTAAPTPTATPTPSRAPASFDPTRRYATVGWLPAGMTQLHTLTGTDQFSLRADPPAGPKDAPSDPAQDVSYVMLRIVPTGYDIRPLDHGVPFARKEAVTTKWPAETETEPVHGRRARWNTNVAAANGIGLRWEYAPDAWAEVLVQGRAAGPDHRATARRIAESVRYGVDEPIPLPFRVPPLPGTLRPMSVSLHTSTATPRAGWNAGISYGDGKRSANGEWPLAVRAFPRSSQTGGGGAGEPNTTIDGHAARRWDWTDADGGEGLGIYGVKGLYVGLVTDDDTTTRQLPGGLGQLFRGMELYPDPRDWR